MTDQTSPVSERLRQFAAYGDTAEGRILAQLALTEIERLSLEHQLAHDDWQRSEARLAQTPAVPDGYVLVPRELTAENGAKAFLSGEFSETFDYMDEEGDECVADIPVSWTTIKAIHKKMVSRFALSDTSTIGNSK